MSPIVLLSIGIIAGILIGLGIAGTALTVRHLQERVRRLEQASPQRLPYRSADEIENATAAILAFKQDLDFKADMVDNALAHLQKARDPK